MHACKYRVLMTMSERKAHLATGILIGMGAMIILLGFFGWFVGNYLFTTLGSIFEDLGIDTSRHFIFNDLNRLMQTQVFIIAIGFVSLFVGVILETFYKRKHTE